MNPTLTVRYQPDEHLPNHCFVTLQDAAPSGNLFRLPSPSDLDGDDGAVNQGYLFEVIPESFAEEENGVKQPFYGLFSVRPFACFYSK